MNKGITHCNRVTSYDSGNQWILIRVLVCPLIGRQDIIWTNDDLWWIETLGRNIGEIWIKIQCLSRTKMDLKMSSAKRHWFCHRGLAVFIWSPAIPLYISPESPPDSKVHGANMGSTWVPSDPYGPHAGPMNLAIRDSQENSQRWHYWFSARGMCYTENVPMGCHLHGAYNGSQWI